MPIEESWLFVAEWFDPQPMLVRQYIMKYFLDSHSIELVDIRTKKLFLKKSNAGPNITTKDFFIGSKVLVYGREMTIVQFGDGKTRSQLEVAAQAAVAILPSASYKDWGTFLIKLEEAGMVLRRVRTLYLDQRSAGDVCSVLGVDAGAAIDSKISLMVHFSGANGIAKMAEICDNVSIQLGAAPALVASDEAQVSDLIQILSSQPSTATLDSCTCCIIKPHAVKSGTSGAIIDRILSEGYEISALDTFQYDKAQSDEFLEVYKDVIPEYSGHVIELCSGLSIAMELRAENAVSTFRQTAGPWDVQMAKELRPKSLRAAFGVDNIRCGIHCTDLPIDGVSECEYCFKIVAP